MGYLETVDLNKVDTHLSYLWVAEYGDDGVAERDPIKGNPNSFYEIDKKRLSRFALVGRGAKHSFDIETGVFNLYGARIHVEYEAEGKRYNLGEGRQDDIITYKKAKSDLSVSGDIRQKRDGILAYFFGYKTKASFNGIDFQFQPLVMFQQERSKDPVLTIKLSANRDIDGKIIIVINGQDALSYAAPIREGISGHINIELQ